MCAYTVIAIQIPIWAWVPFDSSEPCALGSRAIGGSGAGRRVQVMAKMDTDADGSVTVRDRLGRLSVALGDFRSQSVVYGAFAWAHRAYVVYSCCNITSGTLCTVCIVDAILSVAPSLISPESNSPLRKTRS